MAVVRPFRALRPEPHSAAAVAAVPYDVVSTEEARALATPLSFLHVTRPEIDLDPDVDVHDASVYDTARANLARLRETAPLVVEAQPALLARLIEFSMKFKQLADPRNSIQSG